MQIKNVFNEKVFPGRRRLAQFFPNSHISLMESKLQNVQSQRCFTATQFRWATWCGLHKQKEQNIFKRNSFITLNCYKSNNFSPISSDHFQKKWKASEKMLNKWFNQQQQKSLSLTISVFLHCWFRTKTKSLFFFYFVVLFTINRGIWREWFIHARSSLLGAVKIQGLDGPVPVEVLESRLLKPVKNICITSAVQDFVGAFEADL